MCDRLCSDVTEDALYVDTKQACMHRNPAGLHKHTIDENGHQEQRQLPVGTYRAGGVHKAVANTKDKR